MRKTIAILLLSTIMSTTVLASGTITKPDPLLHRNDIAYPVSYEEQAFTFGDYYKSMTTSQKKAYKKDIDGLLMINGTFVQNYFPINQNNTNIVPIQVINERLGIKTEWNGDERKVVASDGQKTVELYIDKKTAYINGKEIELPVPPQIINGKTYVPLRFMAESFGLNVGFDKALLDFPVVWVAEKYDASDIKISESEALTAIFKGIKADKNYPGWSKTVGHIENVYSFKNAGDKFGRYWVITATGKGATKPTATYLVDKYTKDMFMQCYMGIFGEDNLFTVFIAN